MNRIAIFNLVVLVFGTISLSGCTKENQKKNTLSELYKLYENGEISECTYKGETVFSCTLNAYDAPTIIYNDEGEEIGNCNYAWGSVDPICSELSECSVVYCPANNIWGYPAVDKYDLKD